MAGNAWTWSRPRVALPNLIVLDTPGGGLSQNCDRTLTACGLGSALLATEFCANEPWCSFPSVIIENAKDLMALGQVSQRWWVLVTRGPGPSNGETWSW